MTADYAFEVSIVWFRRDLRLEDNPALYVACQLSRWVVPLFVWSPREEGQFQPGRCNRWWLMRSLQSLEKQLEEKGSKLFYQQTESSADGLLSAVRMTGAKAVFYNHLYDPISISRDTEVKQALQAAGVTCQSYNAEMLYEPWEVLDKEGKPFVNLDDFWKKVNNMAIAPMPPLQALESVPPPPKRAINTIGYFHLRNLNLMTREEEASNKHLGRKWNPGSTGAYSLFEKFMTNSLLQFDHDRSKTDRESTSKLSPHIHYGEISVKYMFYRLKAQEWEWRQIKQSVVNCADFLQQMGYREYSRYIMYHFPFAHDRSLLQHLRAVPVRTDHQMFKMWRQGRTGYPLIDAGMRELWSTGWAHNRIRVVVASFLVKNMLLPWQWGLKFCWDCQIDADLECDMLGWQYVSGCLADAHPFSYMIDMSKEILRYDPEGEYVRKWLPMLARLPQEYIHRPWEAPPNILDDAGVELGTMYPYPIIEIQESKEIVDHAVGVINQCVIRGHSQPAQPFRPETDPGLLVRMIPDTISMQEEDEEDLKKHLKRVSSAKNQKSSQTFSSSENYKSSNKDSDSQGLMKENQKDIKVYYYQSGGMLVVQPQQEQSCSFGGSNLIINDVSFMQDDPSIGPTIDNMFGVPEDNKTSDYSSFGESKEVKTLAIKPSLKRSLEDTSPKAKNPWNQESIGELVKIPAKKVLKTQVNTNPTKIC